MLAACIGEGFRSVRKNPALTALLWFWSLILASMAAFPAWIWLGQGFNLRPESDGLLSGFNFALFGELAKYDRSPVRGILFASLLCVSVLAGIANPLVSGGTLEVLRKGKDESKPMKHFWRGAGLHFWRFLRLLLYAAVTAVILLAAVGGAFSAIVVWLDDRPWETGFLLGRLASVSVLAFIGAWILLALDFARVRTAAEGSSRTLRTWFWALVFVWRRPFTTFGLTASMALLFVVAAGVYTAASSRLNPSLWTAIAASIVLQQLLMCYRTSLRVGLVAAELACYRQLFPPAAAPPVVPDSAAAEPEAAGPPPDSHPERERLSPAS